MVAVALAPPAPPKSPSPPPFIKWKPLRKNLSQSPAAVQEGSREERVVSYRSSSPQPVPAPALPSLPKYMLDGRVAYYICQACRVPVGSLLAWREHALTPGHREAAARREGEVITIQSSPSVLHMFGDTCNLCLACSSTFPTNAALYSHEQLEQHRAALRALELRDRERLGREGRALTTLFHCDTCCSSSPALPQLHLASARHKLRLAETLCCLYCPRRLDPGIMRLHTEAHHPDVGFQCRACPR